MFSAPARIGKAIDWRAPGCVRVGSRLRCRRRAGQARRTDIDVAPAGGQREHLPRFELLEAQRGSDPYRASLGQTRTAHWTNANGSSANLASIFSLPVSCVTALESAAVARGGSIAAVVEHYGVGVAGIGAGNLGLGWPFVRHVPSRPTDIPLAGENGNFSRAIEARIASEESPYPSCLCVGLRSFSAASNINRAAGPPRLPVVPAAFFIILDIIAPSIGFPEKNHCFSENPSMPEPRCE